jgi:hypothetical protein
MMDDFSMKEINEMKNNLIWNKSEPIESPGCIYFLRYIELPYIKIGYSSKPTPEERIKSYTAPKGIERLGYFTITNADKIEKEIHESLAEHRVEGEWFDITKEKVDEIIEKYNAHHRNNIQKALMLMQMHDVNELITLTTARKLQNISHDITFIKNLLLNGTVKKSKIINELEKYYGLSNSMTYKKWKARKMYINFKEYKVGRTVYIKLRKSK